MRSGVIITASNSAASKEAKKPLFKPKQGEASADVLVCSIAGSMGPDVQRGA